MTSLKRIAAVSVDLDEIPRYCEIHDLPHPSGSARNAVYRKALPRFLRLFAEEHISCTLFAVGGDLEDEANRVLLAEAVSQGHEIGNHSFHHYYDMTRRDATCLLEEIERGSEQIESLCGGRPKGFRAPGYVVTDALLETLRILGYEYDSSVFPCPAYYLAKATALTMMSMRSRKSKSIVDDPRALLAPADPYRVGRPYWRIGDGILELPIGVSGDRFGRLPYIGTALCLAGSYGRFLTDSVIGRPFINLELHGIDLADADMDNLSSLKRYQPDLRHTASSKTKNLRQAIRQIKSAGYQFETLIKTANHFATAIDADLESF